MTGGWGRAGRLQRSFCTAELKRQLPSLTPKLGFVGLGFSHLLLCEESLGAAVSQVLKFLKAAAGAWLSFLKPRHGGSL